MNLTESATNRFVAVAAAATLLVLPLAACSSSSNSTPPGGVDFGYVGGSGQYVEGGDGSFAPGREAMFDQLSNVNGSVISTGSINIEVADPLASSDRVAEVVEGLGGKVESRTSSDFGHGNVNAAVSVWVPAKKYNEAFDQLGGLGKILGENRNAVDVTSQQAELSARIGALEEAVARLKSLAETTNEVSDLIAIEGELSMRNSELESLKSQYEATAENVDHSRIFVSLSTPVGNSAGPTTFWDGVLTGLASIAAAGAGLLVLLGILLPWIILLGIVVFVIVLARRSSKKRRAKKVNQAEQAARAEQAERAASEAAPGAAAEAEPEAALDSAVKTAERPEPKAPSAEQK